MTATKDYFVHLISSYINGKQPNEPTSDVDWNEFLRLASIHSVQVMTYLVLDKLSEKPPIYNELKNMFIASVNISTKQEHEMKKVTKALNENQINHTLFKGYLLCGLYPDKEARTFGDIDFLIEEKDREKSHKALLNLGYTFDEEHYIKDVWTYNKGVVSLEVHTSIIYEKLFNDFDYITYFKQALDRCVCIDKHTYELSLEDHFIYILVHLAKHFYNAGVGIRMLCDVAVYIKKYADAIDWEYIAGELRKLGLDKFTEFVFAFCRDYLKAEIPLKSNIECPEVAVEYILNHGVFGFDDKNVYDIKFHKGNRNDSLFKRFFISYEEMKANFKWFKNCPVWLLPYGWIRRGFWQITNRDKRENLKGKINSLKAEGKDALLHNKILEEIGLN